jgi:CheY-like chemotaxis protein
MTGEAIDPVAVAQRPLDILIVDDDAIFRDALQRMLSSDAGAAHRFAAAEHARQAIDIIEHQALDLVISDIFMPVADVRAPELDASPCRGGSGAGAFGPGLRR